MYTIVIEKWLCISPKGKTIKLFAYNPNREKRYIDFDRKMCFEDFNLKPIKLLQEREETYGNT